MSTKNLSRTIIEGGRAKRNKDDRWDSNQRHRAQNRQFSHHAKNLIDTDDLGVTPERRLVGKNFDDKLGAVYRWLQSNTGKPWNEVYSELRHRFDIRTTAGRHIIVDHLLGSVARTREFRDLFPWAARFYVDDEGILQVGRGNRSWRSNRGVPEKEISKWADDRRVMDYGVSRFWMVPKTYEWCECGTNYGKWWGGLCHRYHRDAVKLVQVPSHSVLAFEKVSLPQKVVDGVTIYYREQPIKQCRRGSEPFQQGSRFSEKDLEMWLKLSEYDRDHLLWVLPKEDRKKLPFKTNKRFSNFGRY